MNRRAFTLIELLVSLMLFCAVLSSLMFGTFAFIRARDSVERQVERLDSVRYSLYRISSDVRASAGIKASSTPQRIVLDMGTKEVAYDLNGGKVRRSVSGYASYITEDRRITALAFSYPGAGTARIEIGFADELFTSEAMARD